MFSLPIFVLIASFSIAHGFVVRTRRGAYMSSSSYSRPSYGGDQWGQNNNYNPYQNNWNQQNQNWDQYGNRGSQYGSSYGRPSSYGPPQPSYSPPKSSYGRPEPTYSPYSRPSSSYGRPPQFYPAQPGPAVPAVIPPVVTQPIVPPPVPEVSEPVPEPPIPAPGPVAPPTPSGPLFGGVEPGAGALTPGVAPPPTDEEMTRVDAAEKENEVRKARGGPPGINVAAIAETGTLPPQASIPDIPMPPV
ncbi:Prion-like-(Q/N-rich)-domain-bearing protein [Caenorhabditis elegans]|uniref:Prion-like-(Q/N-rich)-domain-bearing protein n=1 Tax=Caenorhabditis elegans TaxID=6239 RepID=Q19395_CAEEL|nr:Prion-like-(Q/N-rich)-domain-bearing protein [Caenorhabditis elegans]CAA88949.1 Prion-like-(Q/N-rich)-domain-bearing protein [Caenorhabditis elegans]|eukprot:NP_496502.1 Uncharacterized protein CELE_F13D12.3 [Caenorhabditis elegans]